MQGASAALIPLPIRIAAVPRQKTTHACQGKQQFPLLRRAGVPIVCHPYPGVVKHLMLVANRDRNGMPIHKLDLHVRPECISRGWKENDSVAGLLLWDVPASELLQRPSGNVGGHEQLDERVGVDLSTGRSARYPESDRFQKGTIRLKNGEQLFLCDLTENLRGRKAAQSKGRHR